MMVVMVLCTIMLGVRVTLGGAGGGEGGGGEGGGSDGGWGEGGGAMEAADEEEARAEAMEAKAGATGLSFFTKSTVASASRSLVGRAAATACLTGRAAFTMSKSSSSSMPWVDTPLSSAGLELVLAPKPT